jgi:hypothetical protein
MRTRLPRLVLSAVCLAAALLAAGARSGERTRAGGDECGAGGGPVRSGASYCGTIAAPEEVDVWTLDARAGDRIGAHVGEVTDGGQFLPRISISAPSGSSPDSNFGSAAAAVEVVAPVDGTYQVLVSSGDAGRAGSGTYRLTVTNSSDPVTISSGDEGGPLKNGVEHTGAITTGDLDVWTFEASAGDRIGAHAGEVTDDGQFLPSVRVWASDGSSVDSNFGNAAAAVEVVAPADGTYQVLVSSGDAGRAGSGAYRLTVTNTREPVTISSGDEGGPLQGGIEHTGEITTGDLDVWTFEARAGDRIGAQAGEMTDGGQFLPLVRIWASDGSSLGSDFGNAAAALEVVAPADGTYHVLVSSGDAGRAGAGTYRLTVTNSSDPVTVASGDEGGPLQSGIEHTGEITTGDTDVWTFEAHAGDRIGAHAGEMTDGGQFLPLVRIWAPDGSSLGSNFGNAAAGLEVVAPADGTYQVLVSSGDAGRAGSGTYRLTVTNSGDPVTVAAGDEGGPLRNGVEHTGAITTGDIDVWTFEARTGDRIGAQTEEATDDGQFLPWIRIWAPDGSSVGSDFGNAAAGVEAVAPADGTYQVLVSSGDAGRAGAGTYRLTANFTERDAPPAAARTNMVRSVPSPLEISTDPDVIATNITLAVITLLVIFGASTLFNGTLAENREEIESWLSPKLDRLRNLLRRLRTLPIAGALRSRRRGARWLWDLFAVLGLTVLVYGFTEPEFGVNTKSLSLGLGLLLTVGAVTYVAEGGKALFAHVFYKADTAVRPFPLAIAIAVVNVVFCRAVGFEPGILFGFVAICVFADKAQQEGLSKARKGWMTLVPLVVLMLVCIAAWFLVIPARAFAENHDIAPAAFLETIAVSLFVTGVQGVVFGMIPLNFLDGHKIFNFNRVYWCVLALGAITLVWQVLVNEDQSYLNSLSSTVPLTAFIILVVVSALSFAFWMFFNLRRPSKPSQA